MLVAQRKETLFKKLWAKFGSKKYREAYVGAHLKRSVPFQIKAMRDRRGWSQVELAERAGLTQGAVSRAEDPDYGNLTFNTVIRIAAGFDVAFVGAFVRFSELARRASIQNEDSVQVVEFQKDATERAFAAATTTRVVESATTQPEYASYGSHTRHSDCFEDAELNAATMPVELLIQANTARQAYTVN